MTSLNLKKFDMNKIGKGSVVVIIGKRNTGKSYLTKDLLWYKRDIPIGTVISGTEGANQFYSKIVPPLFIHDEFSPEIVANSLKRQKLVVAKMKEQEAKKKREAEYRARENRKRSGRIAVKMIEQEQARLEKIKQEKWEAEKFERRRAALWSTVIVCQRFDAITNCEAASYGVQPLGVSRRAT